MTELDRFLAARDFLLAHPDDLDAACAGFSWPQLQHFNWAIDYFDSMARDNDAPALHIAEESGTQARLSYRELSRRSSQVAAFLPSLGAARGDRVLVMLGNEVPLWETMLAAIKAGLVVIPATPLLSGADLADRMSRGKVRWVVTNATGRARIAELPPEATAGLGLILAGMDAVLPPGWIDYRNSHAAPDT
ncbi:MAG: AMP-binding protein, partial [Rubrivivax sp.]